MKIQMKGLDKLEKQINTIEANIKRINGKKIVVRDEEEARKKVEEMIMEGV